MATGSSWAGTIGIWIVKECKDVQRDPVFITDMVIPATKGIISRTASGSDASDEPVKGVNTTMRTCIIMAFDNTGNRNRRLEEWQDRHVMPIDRLFFAEPDGPGIFFCVAPIQDALNILLIGMPVSIRAGIRTTIQDEFLGGVLTSL